MWIHVCIGSRLLPYHSHARFMRKSHLQIFPKSTQILLLILLEPVIQNPIEQIRSGIRLLIVLFGVL